MSNFISQTETARLSTRAHALAGFTGLALAMGVGRFAFTPIFPLMQSDAALTIAHGGWLAAANYLGYLVGALAALAVKTRGSVLIRFALVANAGATIAMGVTHAFGAWLAWRGIAGFASAFLLVHISAVCLRRFARKGQAVLAAALFSGVGAGIFAVGIVCLSLEYFGVRSSTIWLVLGLGSLALSALMWPALSEGWDEQPDEHPIAAAAGERIVWWPMIVSYGLFGFGYIIPATFLPVMAKDAVGEGWLFGLAWPVFGAAAFISTFMAARVSQKTTVRLWRRSQCVLALGVALPVLLRGLTPIVVAALIVGGTFMVITMSAMETARQFAAARARTVMAAMTASFAAGQLAGPIAASAFVSSATGLSALLVAAATSLLVGAALLWRAGSGITSCGRSGRADVFRCFEKRGRT